MENSKKSQPDANPFAGLGQKEKKTLPAVYEFKDGRKLKLQAYQAKGFIDYIKDVAMPKRGEQINPLDITLAILHGICFWVDGTTERRISKAELDEMGEADGMELMSYVEADISDEKAVGEGLYSGTLPSGKILTYQKSTLGTMRKAQELMGPTNAPYAKIMLLCKIDGKELDLVDVQLMDGLDFAAINDALGSRPM